MVDTANEARTINGLLREAADAFGDRPAIRYVRDGVIREHSYRDLYRDSLRLCGALQRRFPAGTHIALIGKTSYRYLVALNAVMMSGCTVVPLAADAPAEETARLLRDADAAVLQYGGETWMIDCGDERAAKRLVILLKQLGIV